MDDAFAAQIAQELRNLNANLQKIKATLDQISMQLMSR